MERTTEQAAEPQSAAQPKQAVEPRESAVDPQGPTTADPRAIKVSVSMPGTLVAEVRARVGKREFSRYVADAVERRLKLDQLGEIVDAHVAEFGPLDPELIRKAEAEWHAAFGE